MSLPPPPLRHKRANESALRPAEHRSDFRRPIGVERLLHMELTGRTETFLRFVGGKSTMAKKNRGGCHVFSLVSLLHGNVQSPQFVSVVFIMIQKGAFILKLMK